MGNDTLDRFQLLEANELQLPHKCTVCGGFSGRKFIDFGAWVEFYGVIYICDQCLTGAARVVGCVPSSLYNTVEKQLAKTTKVISQLTEENGRLRSAVDSFRTIANPVIDTGSKFSLVDTNTNESLVNQTATATESRPVEQTNERGSSFVRVDDSNSTANTTLSELGLDI